MLLSIESSCDDSAIAITEIDTLKLIYNKKIVQNEHCEFGGVVPEIAARLHTEILPNLLLDIKQYLPSIKAIGVTSGPGLSVSLMGGVMMAKALSLALKIPLISVDHLKGHIYSLFIEKKELFPISVLLVSGGHTMLIKATHLDDIKVIASTSDDSFGESFDKVSKMLGFGYPGGLIVENLAKNGDEDKFPFSIPLLNTNKLSFSYSGLKNSVRLAILNSELTKKVKSDIAASFQKIAVEHLLLKTKQYFKMDKTIKNFAIVGGASSNIYLRKKYEKLCNNLQIKLHLTSLEFCSDNAAMIGRVAIESYKIKDFIDIENLVINPKHTLRIKNIH